MRKQVEHLNQCTLFILRFISSTHAPLTTRVPFKSAFKRSAMCSRIMDSYLNKNHSPIIAPKDVGRVKTMERRDELIPSSIHQMGTHLQTKDFLVHVMEDISRYSLPTQNCIQILTIY